MSLEWISRDGKLILSARIVRTFSYGFLSVILAIYLQLVGFNEILIGFVLTATLVNSVIFNIISSVYADKIGRRKFLILYYCTAKMLSRATAQVKGAPYTQVAAVTAASRGAGK